MRPPGTTRPVVVYLATTFTTALAIALAFPHMGVAPLLTALVPFLGVVVTVATTTARGARGGAWRAVGWRRPGAGALGIALLLPAAVAALSFGFARIVGVARFPGLGVSPDGAANLLVMLVLGSLLFLGEEIGWRGFLYPRLGALMPRKVAAVVTGLVHAVFHLPLLLLTTTYQTAGNRLVVVPTVLVTIAAGGVVYAWLRDRSGSVWAVSVMHNAFNTFMELGARLAVPTSAAALAYTTTETGAATLVLALALAGWLLSRRWPTGQEGAVEANRASRNRSTSGPTSRPSTRSASQRPATALNLKP